jgi:hypothetical protein
MPRGALILLLSTALAGCADNAFYLRSDPGAGVALDLAGLDQSVLAEHPLQVAVTFKSDGMVDPEASTTLYQSIAGGLRSHGFIGLRRYSPIGGDAAIEIALLEKAAADSAVPAPAAPPADAPATAPPATPAPLTAPRLLVLVENRPDLSGGTRARYFFSGLSMGAWSPNRATDSYSIVIAYTDPQGRAHIHRSHQELIAATGTSLFGRDDQELAGLRHYEDPIAAFGGAVLNSFNGGNGVVTVGKPKPGGSAAPPPAAPAAASPAH